MNGVPKTIEELKQWYVDKNLPPEDTTRFFIGTDYKDARAFGIYQDEATGDFIVYKNKSDGSRAIRYQGKDEAHAVNELFLKLRDEIANQKVNNGYEINRGNQVQRKQSNIGTKIFVAIFALTFAIISFFAITSPKRGYYLYNDDYYYYQNGSWYEYDDYQGWYYVTTPRDLKKHSSDYYQSYYYNYYDIDSFENSSYYQEPTSSDDDDWDSDWDSSDSWDSGSTDWDSDW